MRQAVVIALAIGLGVTSVAAPAKKLPKKGPASTGDYLVSGVESSTEKSDADLLRMLKGFQFLLKREPAGKRRDDLLLASSSAALALARNIRIRQNPTASDLEEEAKFTKVALHDASESEKSTTATAAQKGRSMYYEGLAYIDLRKNVEAQNIFAKAIQLYPDDPAAPAMSIFIAEALFDNEKYKEAIAEYSRYYKKQSPAQKAIAVYKIAWSYLNLQNFDMSEKNFFLLAGKPWAGALAKDSIQDLAYTMSIHRDDDNVIEYTKAQLPHDPALRVDLLTRVYKFYLSESGVHEHPKLFAELLRIEKDPAKRLELFIINLRSKQKSYASMEPYKEFLNLRKEMDAHEVTAGSKVFAQISNDLEPEVETIVKAFNETFKGKTKTPEELTRPMIGQTLLTMLAFHTEFFPKSIDRPASYDIWLDVCQDLKDTKCSYQVSRKIMDDSSLERLHKRARLTWLAALDELIKTERKYRKEFIGGLTKFYEDSAADPQWLSLTKRLTALLMEDKDYTTAIPILKKLDFVEKTPESRFRYVWTLFQANQFKDVVAAGAAGNDKFATDSKKLVRESHLRLAQQEIDKNNFSEYETHINAFIAADPNDPKSELVRRDFMNRLLDRHEEDKVFDFLIKMPYQQRFSVTYKPTSVRLVDTFLKTGVSASAFAMITKGKTSKDPDTYELERFQALLGMDRAPTQHELVDLHKASSRLRSYVLDILTLAKPETTMAYYRTWPPLTNADKNLLLLAHQVKAGAWEVELDPRTTQVLGSVMPAELKQVKLTWVEKQIQAIQIPEKISEKRLVKLADQVRRTRPLVVQALTGKLAKIQKRILAAAIGLEDKMAVKIGDSPIPAGLAPDQETQYRAGVANLAKEYSDQAAEYKKIIDSMDKTASDAEKQKKAMLDSFSLSDWPLPKGDLTDSVKKLMDKHNLAAALVAIDRAKNGNEIKPEEYFALRTWILISDKQTDFMKEYARIELENAKQDELLKKWGDGKK